MKTNLRSIIAEALKKTINEGPFDEFDNPKYGKDSFGSLAPQARPQEDATRFLGGRGRSKLPPAPGAKPVVEDSEHYRHVLVKASDPYVLSIIKNYLVAFDITNDGIEADLDGLRDFQKLHIYNIPVSAVNKIASAIPGALKRKEGAHPAEPASLSIGIGTRIFAKSYDPKVAPIEIPIKGNRQTFKQMEQAVEQTAKQKNNPFEDAENSSLSPEDEISNPRLRDELARRPNAAQEAEEYEGRWNDARSAYSQEQDGIEAAERKAKFDRVRANQVLVQPQGPPSFAGANPPPSAINQSKSDPDPRAQLKRRFAQLSNPRLQFNIPGHMEEPFQNTFPNAKRK